MKQIVIYIRLALVVLFSGVVYTASAGEGMREQKIIIDFVENGRSEWYVINDGVMGGVSSSDIKRSDRNTGLFAGELSLENNGGFASVRAMVGQTDLSGYAGIEIRVRGDGRTYQLRLRTDDHFDGIAYRAHFETRDGEWTVTRIPFDEFLPSFRGRTPTNAAPLDTSRIHQVSFMLADQKSGAFALEIDFVQTF